MEVVMITGASAGVGRATAQAFARRGAHIGLLARGLEGLEAARKEVEALGGTALALPADVADPALNTPQFTWCKTRMPRHPQPVPPVFQPEVAAAAILWAAEHRPRELKVGVPTLKAVWANKLMPDFLDRYLAWTGYDGQQTEEPVDPDRPNNLWTSVPGAAAHGRFDRQARRRSWQLWTVTHGALAAFAAAIVLAAGLALLTLAV